MSKSKKQIVNQPLLFDVPAVKPEVHKENKGTGSTIDATNMGLVAITEGRCKLFKTIADSFGNKLR